MLHILTSRRLVQIYPRPTRRSVRLPVVAPIVVVVAPLVEFKPHRVQNGESTGEAETQNPREIPHWHSAFPVQ
jgi:hypothetical protein